jgi:hypothetical protein
MKAISLTCSRNSSHFSDISYNNSHTVISAMHMTEVWLLKAQGRATAQEVSRRLLTAATRVRAHVRTCRICGEQSGTGARLLRVIRFSLPILIPPTAPHSSSIIRGWYNRPVNGRHTKRTQSDPTPGRKRNWKHSYPTEQQRVNPMSSYQILRLSKILYCKTEGQSALSVSEPSKPVLAALLIGGIQESFDLSHFMSSTITVTKVLPSELVF